MMKVFYCPSCERIAYTKYLHVRCKTCDKDCIRLKITYSEYTMLNADERKEYLNKLNLKH